MKISVLNVIRMAHAPAPDSFLKDEVQKVLGG